AGLSPMRKSESGPTGRKRPDVRLFRFLRVVFSVVFFLVFPLFLRRRIFSSSRKALPCNGRAFFVVNRLYFPKKIFRSVNEMRGTPPALAHMRRPCPAG